MDRFAKEATPKAPQGHLPPASDGEGAARRIAPAMAKGAAPPPQIRQAGDAPPDMATKRTPAERGQPSTVAPEMATDVPVAPANSPKRRASHPAPNVATRAPLAARDPAREGGAQKGLNSDTGRGQSDAPGHATNSSSVDLNAPARATFAAPAKRGAAGGVAPEMANLPAPPPKNSKTRSAAEGAPDRAKDDAPGEKLETAADSPPEMAMQAAPSPAEICAELVRLQRRRRFCIRMQSRIDQGLNSVLARALGYHTALEEKERKKIYSRVAEIRRVTVVGDQLADLSELERFVATDWLELILETEQSRTGWDEQRTKVETRMCAYVRQLPVWPWAASIRGFAEKGLAVIIGEACGPAAPELGDYRSHQNLCKRLGIGVVDGRGQGESPKSEPRKGASADPDERRLARKNNADYWKRQGYSPQRRAEVYAFLDSVMLRAQWRNEGGAQGSYGAVYARRVKEYEERGWSHAKKAAARMMAKELIKDLWRAWRRTQVDFVDGATPPPPEGRADDAPSTGGGAAETSPPQGQAGVAAPSSNSADGARDLTPKGQKGRAPPAGEGPPTPSSPQGQQPTGGPSSNSPDGAKDAPPNGHRNHASSGEEGSPSSATPQGHVTIGGPSILPGEAA